MKKYILLLTICLLGNNILHSQSKRSGLYGYSSRNSANVRTGLFGSPLKGTTSISMSSLGASNLYGDIGGNASYKELLGLTDWKLSETQLFISLGFLHVFPSTLGFKVFASYGDFSGSDKDTRQTGRGFSFETTVFDFAVQGVGTLLGGPYGRYKSRHWLYGAAGLGVMTSTPTLKQDNIIISKPDPSRNTTSYKKETVTPPGSLVIAPMIPVSIGYSYKFSDRFSAGVEGTYRNVFSDQIDGFSSRFSKVPYDGIASISVTLTYKMSGGILNEYDCNCDWQ